VAEAIQDLQDALERAARGDTSAFGQVVRQHQGMVFSMAYHFLRDRGCAEELAQDVFLQLYQNLAAIDSPAHLKAWLRKVTCHRCVDFARRCPTYQPMSLAEIPEPSAATEECEPQLATRLREIVASLPGKRRLVLILRYQEELELQEIAEALEMPINTVKSCLQRSLALLKRKLARVTGDVRL
jgi:RNA polymerase sigma-70 factor (ECF subfamily)